MRVLINGRFLWGPKSGVQRVARELIKSIDAMVTTRSPQTAGKDLILTCPKTPDLAAEGMDQIKIQVKGRGNASPVLWEQFNYAFECLGGYSLNFCNTAPLLPSRALTLIHDAQVYISPKSYSWAFRTFYKALLPLIGARHRHIVTVSEFSRQALIRHGVAPAHKITVVHNGSDHILAVPSDDSLFKSLNIPARGFVLGAANTQSHKNVRVVIDAFRDPSLSDLKLVLYGGATQSDFEKNLGRELPSNVVFVGHVKDTHMRGLLENALCFCFPSLTEGFGLPVVEAMQLECPTIVAPCGALPEVCADASLYAAADAPEIWAQTIMALKDDPILWQQTSKAGKARAETFTWDRAAKEILRLIDA